MTFGPEGTGGARISSIETVGRILDTFKARGYDELDTARGYCDGQEEAFVTKAGWKEKGFKMATKCYPVKPGTHAAGPLREALETSLKELKTDKLDVFYLHAPDWSVPLADTVEAMDVFHKEGKFDVFGISNFAVFTPHL
jgi:aflatoxin B1 aldehyde reductase